MYKAALILSMAVGVLIFVACKARQKSPADPATAAMITMIGMRHAGGEMSYQDELIITKDSTSWFSGMADPASETRIDTVTPPQLWAALSELAKHDRFYALKDGSSQQPVDGIDEYFFISTAEGKDTVLNEIRDENYFQLLPLFNRLKAIAQQFGSGRK